MNCHAGMLQTSETCAQANWTWRGDGAQCLEIFQFEAKSRNCVNYNDFTATSL